MDYILKKNGFLAGVLFTVAAAGVAYIAYSYNKKKKEDVEQMTYYTPLKEDGEAAAFLKAMPITDTEKCKGCRECVYVCPMNCYMNSVSEPEGICIKCQGCVKACPEGAKYFSNEDFVSHVRYLEKNYTDENKEIEIY